MQALRHQADDAAKPPASCVVRERWADWDRSMVGGEEEEGDGKA